MELLEALKEEGVDTLEALKVKIIASEKVKSDLILEGKNTQIEGLETIKTESSEKLAAAGRTIAELTPAPISKEKEAEDEQAAAAEVEASLKQENKARSENLSDEDDAKLVEAYGGLEPDVRKLIDGSAEGLSSFMDGVLGSDKQPLQKTFRQPVEQVKLSVEEQVLAALKPTTSPRLRPQGLAVSTGTSTKQAQSAPAIDLGSDGGILSAIAVKRNN